jgi:hypothetical protein
MKVIWYQIHDSKQLIKEKILRGLGYTVYGASIIQNKKHYYAWNTYIITRTRPDWNVLLKDHDAMVAPLSINNFKSIYRTFPDAKVIIDDVDANEYIRRFKRLYNFIRFVSFLRFNARINKTCSILLKSMYIFFRGDLSDKNIKQTALSFKREILQIVPPENLLLVKRDSGWREFTDFFGKPKPSFSYPLYSSIFPNAKHIWDIILISLRKNWLGYTLYFGALFLIMIYLLFFY